MASQPTLDRRRADRIKRKGEAADVTASSLPDLAENVFTRTDDETKQFAEELEIERVKRAERIKLTLAEPAKARVRVEAVMPLDDEL